MNKPTLYEKIHWNIFNVGAKLFAIMLVIICGAFIVLTISGIIGKPIGEQYGAGSLLLFVPLFIIGILMLKKLNHTILKSIKNGLHTKTKKTYNKFEL